MRTFDVLDRHEKVHQNTLLEASAGTGKTFSIENVVVRLLIEDPAFTLDQILLVTFTRAATRELKERVRQKIALALQALRAPTEETADYLLSCIESGDVEQACRRLDDALFAFDEAQIFTIHGFCFRMLQEYRLEGGLATVEEEALLPSEVERVIRDFFRTELSPDLLSPIQLNLLLNAHRGSSEELTHALRRYVTDTTPIQPVATAKEHYEQFLSVMEGWSPKSLMADFERVAPAYKKTCDRQGKLLSSLREAAEKEAEILAQGHWDRDSFDSLVGSGLKLAAALDPNQRKARGGDLPEGIDLTPLEWLRDTLLPLILEAGAADRLFILVAHHCQKLVSHVLHSRDLLTPDGLLEKMAERARDSSFAAMLQQRYRAAVIDEFQDTDPLQWEIVERIFLGEEWPGALYLVGDPKQSIYAFRQADIYTYLKAADQLGKEQRARLVRNYRSTTPLVHALNALLTDEALFPLPRENTSMPCPAVEAREGVEGTLPKDRGAIHFLVAEGKQGRSSRWPTAEIEQEGLFSFVADEILRLEGTLKLSDFAVLVRDRYEAARLAEYLREKGLPTLLRRDRLLTDSLAYEALIELLQAVLLPRNRSSLKLCLGGPFYQWTAQDLLEGKDLRQLATVFGRLHQLWRDHGFTVMMEEALHGPHGFAARLLRSDALLYRDLEQWVELLAEKLSKQPCAPERLVEELRAMSSVDATEDPQLRCRRDTEEEAVQIMTLHTSKGLEFEVVFATGLATRTAVKERFARTEQGWVPFDANEPHTQDYLRELDAEKMRQLYVAMTRAKQRLYLPLLIANDRKEVPDLGMASPMELFWEGTREEAFSWLATKGSEASITYSMAEGSTEGKRSVAVRRPDLMPPPKPTITGEPLFIASYSSLAQVQRHSPVQRREDEEVKSLYNMPAGARTGLLLHAILEHMDFSNPESMKEEVIRVVKDTELEPWTAALQNCMESVATTRLPCGATIRETKNLLREMPFLYQSKTHGTLMKGYIDAILEVDDRLYVIDWKSNHLGPDASHYTRDQLETAMEAHDYHLQSRIYQEAVIKYIQAVEQRDPSQRWGGCYYLFLRALPDGEGIYP